MTYKLRSEYCDNIAFGITLKCESNYYLFNIFISGSKNQLEIFIYTLHLVEFAVIQKSLLGIVSIVVLQLLLLQVCHTSMYYVGTIIGTEYKLYKKK